MGKMQFARQADSSIVLVSRKTADVSGLFVNRHKKEKRCGWSAYSFLWRIWSRATAMTIIPPMMISWI